MDACEILKMEGYVSALDEEPDGEESPPSADAAQAHSPKPEIGAAVCMHMMCACMCKLHVLFQYVLVCIKHQWHNIVWQINQKCAVATPLLNHTCV